jgi:hypothetical protein
VLGPRRSKTNWDEAALPHQHVDNRDGQDGEPGNGSGKKYPVSVHEIIAGSQRPRGIDPDQSEAATKKSRSPGLGE